MKSKIWKAYNRSLVQRGSVTVYLAAALARKPRGEASTTGRRGRPQKHADWVIELALTLQALYRLPLRQTQGLLAALFLQAGFAVPVPDYSTLCRRRVGVRLPRWRRSGLVLAVDATGLQIGGPGAWFTSVHGHRHRSWRKLHLGVNPRSGDIVAARVTGFKSTDGRQLGRLLDQADAPRGAKVVADGAYDNRRCYAEAKQRHLRLVAPPRKTAKLHAGPEWRARNRVIARVKRIGRAAWKVESGYHARSLVESTMWRLKSAFGPTLRSRCIRNQNREALLRVHLLNNWPTPNSLALGRTG